jgi:hypothetical protein
MSVDGWQVWTAFFDLPAMEEKVLVFEYQLPGGVLSTDGRAPDGVSRYRLWVQKQPGTEAVPLWVEITLPPGAELVDAPPSLDGTSSSDQPPGSLPATGSAAWAGNLHLDREFAIVFRRR